MKKAGIAILIVVVLLVLGGWLYFALFNSKRTYNWFESYRAASDQPYGLKYFNRLLAEDAPNGFTQLKSSPHKELNKADTNSLYVFIGESMYLDTADENALLDFVKRGNTAFISSKAVPENIMYEIYDQSCKDWEGYSSAGESDSVNLYFYHSQFEHDSAYRFRHMFISKPQPIQWYCIDAEYLCDSLGDNITALGYLNNGYVNFIKLDYGKGAFYLHTTPLVFTNYFIRSDTGYAYANVVFSHLGKGHIYWDEVSKLPLNGGGGDSGNNPLAYILSQSALRRALYLLLLLTVIYVLFVARRRQRTLPVLEVPVNTSLEYLRTVAMLYFRNGDHTDAAAKKIKYFLSFIRSRYGLSTTNINDEFYVRLSLKSGVPLQEIRTIFTQVSYIEKYSEVYPDQFWELSVHLNRFYQQCKK